MFTTTEGPQLAHIIVTSLTGQVASNELTPPDPDKIESYGPLIIQAVVALVTIWSTIRKALQKPENTAKAPVVVVVAAPGTPVPAEPAVDVAG